MAHKKAPSRFCMLAVDFYAGRKFTGLRDNAVLSWVKATAWSADQLTDGEVPASQMRVLGATPGSIRDLLEAGLIYVLGVDGAEESVYFREKRHKKVFKISDFTRWQSTRAEVKKDRAISSESSRRYREKMAAEQDEQKRRDASRGTSRDVHSDPPRDADVTPPISKEGKNGITETPLPSPQGEPPAQATGGLFEPTGVVSSTQTDRGAGEGTAEKAPPKKSKRNKVDYSPEFERFWAEYPKKEGKKEALEKWNIAIRSGADVEVIIRAASKYAELVTLEQRSSRTIKNASGWLNGERWNDEVNTSIQSATESNNPLDPGYWNFPTREESGWDDDYPSEPPPEEYLDGEVVDNDYPDNVSEFPAPRAIGDTPWNR